MERTSEEALAGFVAQTEKAWASPWSVSARSRRSSAARAWTARFYDALLGRLTETAPLRGDALEKLAAARAGAVAEHLEKTLSVAPTRVQRSAAAADGERAKLALDVAK